MTGARSRDVAFVGASSSFSDLFLAICSGAPSPAPLPWENCCRRWWRRRRRRSREGPEHFSLCILRPRWRRSRQSRQSRRRRQTRLRRLCRCQGGVLVLQSAVVAVVVAVAADAAVSLHRSRRPPRIPPPRPVWEHLSAVAMGKATEKASGWVSGICCV